MLSLQIFGDFFELLNLFAHVRRFPFKGVRQTVLDMILHENRLGSRKRVNHGMKLLSDFKARAFFADHFGHAIKMPGSASEPLGYIMQTDVVFMTDAVSRLSGS